MNREQEKQKAEQIREQYIEREESSFSRLQRLDEKVKRPAAVISSMFGTVGALALGTGLCLSMKVIGDFFALGVAVGCVGIVMVSVNYALYRAILKARKRKYAAEILSLSDKLLREGE